MSPDPSGPAVTSAQMMNARACAALVDEWARHGVRQAFVAPGSRSTPLALALAAHPQLQVHVVLDERSAAFAALGSGLASGVPAVALCTSGTAAAHFHAAVLEAAHAGVPLIVATADRPPELRDVGAGQTIDQQRLYGTAPRWYFDPGPPADPAHDLDLWRWMAARSVAAAAVGHPGPVHLNLPFREPLVPPPGFVAEHEDDARPFVAAVPGAPVLHPGDTGALADFVRAHPRGLLLVGWGAGVDAATVARFCAHTGWVAFADTISGARGDATVHTYEALLRAGFGPGHRPDAVVRVGAPLTSKSVLQWLDRSVPHVVIDPHRRWLDPARTGSVVLTSDAAPLLDAVAAQATPVGTDWSDAWATADQRARRALQAALDTSLSAPRVVRDALAAVPSGGTALLASSMAVRDAEWFATPAPGTRAVANRGTNGIDGLVSTAVGLGIGSGAPVVAVLGDLAFLHDHNGLLLAARTGADVTFVVIDDDGGAIFSFLPQHDALSTEDFELLFGTPHGLDLVAVAQAAGVPAQRCTSPEAMHEALAAAVGAPGARVLVVPTDRAANVALHRELWRAAAEALA